MIDGSEEGEAFMEPPDRPTSCPPALPEGLSPMMVISKEVSPDRPRSAPGFADDDLGEDAEAQQWSSRPILDPKGKDLFAFQASGHPPPRSPSPCLCGVPATDVQGDALRASPSPVPGKSTHSSLQATAAAAAAQSAVAANMLALQAARMQACDSAAALGTLTEDERFTPPPQAHHPHLGSLSQSPGPHSQSPCFGCGGYHPAAAAYGGDEPALLHPGAVRAFDPIIDRSMSAPPAPEYGQIAGLQAAYSSGDIRCDELYPQFFQMFKGQNVNLPKPLDPCPDIVNHINRSELGHQSTLDRDPSEHGGTQPSLGLTGFAAATGFNPHMAAAVHGGHIPRSPSPPWDGAASAAALGSAHLVHQAAAASAAHAAAAAHAHHAAVVQQAQQSQQDTMALAARQLAEVSLQQQRQQQPSQMQSQVQQQLAGLPGGPGGPYAAAMAAALSGRPLLGPAGYPPAGFGEVPPSVGFPWSQADVLPATPADPALGSRGSQEAGSRRPGGDMVPPWATVSSPAADLAAAMEQQRHKSVVPRGSAPPPGAPIGAGLLPESRGQLGVPAREPETAADRKPARSSFKLSHLEEMFNSHAYISNVYSIAKDQAGCRMLQHKLDEGSGEVFAAVFQEASSHFVELMCDPFGNYLCQKLMEMCSIRQLEVILDRTCGSLVHVALNMHGARAVQKLIDVVRTVPTCSKRLVAALEGSVVALTKDPNGNHVVQRCLESLPGDDHVFIFRSVAQDIVDVASHRHGCRIVQRCVDAATGSERIMLVSAICQSSLTLVQDPFGNYVVQYVLGLHDPTATTLIVSSMLGRLHVLSRQKFSSHFVERCLQLANPEDQARMITELADPRGLGELLRDVYGNYVVQSALNIAVEPQISYIIASVKPLLPSLRSSGQGRRIAQKLEKKFPQLKGINERAEARFGPAGGGSVGSSSVAGPPAASLPPSVPGGSCQPSHLGGSSPAAWFAPAAAGGGQAAQCQNGLARQGSLVPGAVNPGAVPGFFGSQLPLPPSAAAGVSSGGGDTNQRRKGKRGGGGKGGKGS
eukprot:TRINITY_DN23439_c0_g1_i2.p1 TRINITY_DN23439_c0_g1~~TRINITY_DN23439_c0_g1_i2.p1  ORF type:complete len:1038 (+),score=189.94 TRINITY_DN23439_c0_g1_i2:101-3214(+)